jgi:DNA-binding HxlR family transcriptional regulator
MVTNLFGESEPMKWALRKKVGELLSFMVGYKDTAHAEYTTFTNATQTRVLEIVSLLEISSRSGLVSPMNFSILKKEFSGLLGVLNTASKTSHSESEYATLPKTFFDVPDTRSVSTLDKNDIVIKDKKTVSVETIVFKKTNRQNIILNMLKKKKDLTIKDISEVIQDCSEKTIQRELIDLIENGIVEKRGERRWSRYSLKTSETIPLVQ